MTQFKCSEKTLALLAEASKNYRRMVNDINEKEKVGMLNSVEIKLRQEIFVLWESHQVVSANLMLESGYTWEEVVNSLHLFSDQIQNLKERILSSEKKPFITIKKMTQLDYLAMLAIMETKDKKIRDAKLQEFTSEEFNDILEEMDNSDWRIHPIYGCVHKDVFQAMDVAAVVEQPTRYDSEMCEAVLDKWKEGRKEQTFQTHDE